MIISYWNLPMDEELWSDKDNEIFNNSCKNFHELKMALANEFPDIYAQLLKRFDLIKDLADDPDLAII